MLQMITWLDKNFSSLQPTRAIIMRALRHLRPADRKKLFSKDIPEMRTAEGRWFEAIIYEMILDLSLQTDLILSVVARGADGPARVRRAQLGQNGLFYSNIGDILGEEFFSIRGAQVAQRSHDDRPRRLERAEVLVEPRNHL